MVQHAKVLALDGVYASVLVVRRSACAGCRQQGLCTGSCEDGSGEKPMRARVKNTADARPGDEVLVSSGNGAVLGAAFSVFVLPILCGIAAACAVERANVLAGAAAFLLTGAACGIFWNRLMRTRFCPEITEIIRAEEKDVPNEKNETINKKDS